MDKLWRRHQERGSEVAELWLASTFLSAIVFSSLLLHCCIFGNDAHRGATFCARIAVVLAQPSEERQATTLPPPKQTSKVTAASIGEPFEGRCRTTASSRLVVSMAGALAARNVMTLGSLRIDNDVGLHDLNVTYLI